MEMEVIDRGAQSESSTILSTHLVPDGSTLAWSRICILVLRPSVTPSIILYFQITDY